MSDPRSADHPMTDAPRTRLEAWLNQQNQSLLEEVMATWQSALARFRPDEALLADLQAAAPTAPGDRFDAPDLDLALALDLLEGATSQGDLLKRLLDALTPMVERSALFILKQGLASLYSQRGFEGTPSGGKGAIVPPDELSALIHGTGRSLRRKGPAYAALLGSLSTFEAADVAIFPLLHKRRAVALVLVDSGLRKALDRPEQIRALVLVASAMLAALAAGKEEEPRHSPAEALAAPSAPTQLVRDPIPPQPAVDLDPKTRAAAERLARVLVGDVELYFPAKVAQARTQGNLYSLLRDELERSRATFVDRFGEEVETRYRIFTSTLVQLLCDGEASRLGNVPWP